MDGCPHDMRRLKRKMIFPKVDLGGIREKVIASKVDFDLDNLSPGGFPDGVLEPG